MTFKPMILHSIHVSFVLLCCGSQLCIAQTADPPAGTVATVADRVITITLSSKTRPTVGDHARIYINIPGLDQKADVATATVTRVTTEEIEASIVSATGTIKVGQQVEFLKSTTTKTPKPGTIPNLVGLSAEQAKAQLATLNLQASFQVGDPAPSADREFTVAQQQPAAGSPAADNRTITVTLFGRAATAGKKLDLASALISPTNNDRRCLRETIRLLEAEHVSGATFDDERSRQALQQFLDTLDSEKLIFLQTDVAQFRKLADQLDDLSRDGDLRLAYAVFEAFLRRLDDRLVIQNELLDRGFDFEKEESFLRNSSDRDYATSKDELRDMLRRSLKYRVMQYVLAGSDVTSAGERVRREWDAYRRRMYAVNDEDLLETFATSVCRTFDSGSRYLSASSFRSAKVENTGQLVGIGIRIQFDDGHYVVQDIVPGGPAARAGGLAVGDTIIAVAEGTDADFESIEHLPQQRFVSRLRGKKGTTVRVRVMPASGSRPVDHTIVRDNVDLASQRVQGDVVEHATADGKRTRIGHLRLPAFYGEFLQPSVSQPITGTSADVQDSLDRFRSENVDIVVLDLRENTGGVLHEVLKTLNLFLPGGRVCVRRWNRELKTIPMTTEENPRRWSGPLVVLVTRRSNPLCEVFAAAIQDHRRGLIAGDAVTRGTAGSARVVDLGQRLTGEAVGPEIGAVMLTTELYYRATGLGLHGFGVPADVIIPSAARELVGETPPSGGPGRLPRLTIEPLDYGINQRLREELMQRSRERCASSTEFQQLAARIAAYQQRIQASVVSLRFDPRTGRDPASRPNDATDSDFYLQEAFHVASDYVDRLDAVSR